MSSKANTWMVFAAAAAAMAACDGPDERPAARATYSQAVSHAMLRNPAPGQGPALPAPPAPPGSPGLSTMRAESALALVLYDETGPWGGLGELYAIATVNLIGHFGPAAAKPASAYVCREIENYAATFYLGSTYDEPLPTCLLDDVLATQRPVVWSFYNLWKLTERAGGSAAFAAARGWTWTGFDFAAIPQVRYKGRSLTRYVDNGAGLLGTRITDSGLAHELATAIRGDGTTVPWAVRSGAFTYLAEIPFSYMSEEDRYLVFADLLFDVLAPGTIERHRALVRIEDVDPTADSTELRAVADHLHARNIPFGVSLIPDYEDPKGFYNGGRAQRTVLAKQPGVVSALKYMLARGGVLVQHGQTHQWAGGPNPYTGVTGDDTEFFRVLLNPDHTVTYVGPLPGASQTWAANRIKAGRAHIQTAGLAAPSIFEFPHYAASAPSYRAAAASYVSRWERSFYFPGQLRGAKLNETRPFGQLFPYPVRDLWGMNVLPENLGSIEPEPFYSFPRRLPADVIGAAERAWVVRDGVAAFYFHPFFDIAYLDATVDGIRALGYVFVSPNAL